MTATEKLKATDQALAEARARHPDWGIWLSTASRYWASRQGNIRFAKHANSRWAMTVDADSLPELEARLREQEEYDQYSAPSLDDFEDPQKIPRKEGPLR